MCRDESEGALLFVQAIADASVCVTHRAAVYSKTAVKRAEERKEALRSQRYRDEA